MAAQPSLTGLPGADLVEKGLDDLQRRAETVESLLVSIGAPRLRACGVDVAEPIPSPEKALYGLLAERHGDAGHGRYNALLRRLVSYEHALAVAARADA